MNEYGLKKKTRGQARQIRRVPVMTATEAVKLVKDADVVAMCGCGGGINEATELICALAERYRQTQTPRDLTFYHSTGLGDRGDKGMSPLAQKGLVKRDIGGHWGQSPRLCEMAERNENSDPCRLGHISGSQAAGGASERCDKGGADQASGH